MRRPSLLLAIILLVLIPTTASASVTRFASNGIWINSESCRQATFTIRVDDADDLTDAWISGTIELWLNGKNTGSTFIWERLTNGAASDTFQWCPWEGAGLFKLKTVDLEVDGDDQFGDYIERPVASATTYVNIKQAAGFQYLRLARSGSKVTLTSRATYYRLGAGQNYVFPKGTPVSLRRGAYGGTTTTPVKTLYVGDSGVIKFSFTSTGKYRYQLWYPGNSKTWYRLSPAAQG